MISLMNEMAKEKNVYVASNDIGDLENFAENFDIIVTNFSGGKPHNPVGLFHMGVGYATKVPILELEGNSAPYPPLLGLARRVLIGMDRFEHAEYYLKELGSQHINDESTVYYRLMKKFNVDEKE